MICKALILQLKLTQNYMNKFPAFGHSRQGGIGFYGGGGGGGGYGGGGGGDGRQFWWTPHLEEECHKETLTTCLGQCHLYNKQ